jgi:hypothetical protein
MEKQLTGSYLNNTNNTIGVDFVNELNKKTNATLLRSGFSSEEEVIVLAYENLIKAKMNALPRAMERPTYITYEEGAFAVSGKSLKQQQKNYSKLSDSDKAIVDALILKIFEVKGVNMTELFSRLGSDLVTINGVEYPYSDFVDITTEEVDGEEVQSSVPSAAFVAAIQLATQIYNGL